MDIGFVGLGNMGSGMAANLLKAGHRVTAYNRSQDKVDALAEQGARPPAPSRTPAAATPWSRCWPTTTLSRR